MEGKFSYLSEVGIQVSLTCYQDLGQAENYCATWADVVTQLNALFPHYKGGKSILGAQQRGKS